MPILENMGLRVINERSHRLDRRLADGNSERISIHDMTLERADGQSVDLDEIGQRLEAGFMAVILGNAENDGFNALLVHGGLGWRDIAVLRTYARYLRQARIPYSQDYLWEALNRNGAIAALMVDLFHTRFTPATQEADARQTAEEDVAGKVLAALADVPSLDDDRIIRRFLNAIRATLRTNYFQLDSHGQPRGAIAVKIHSADIDELPLPRPYAEIFVYSPRVEGVHLRFGHIARGGLRWSDRPQDFRTEVLGLVKAQQVKKRGHRAGRGQGRLRAQEAEAGLDPRRGAGRGHRLLQAVRVEPSRSDRQSRRRRGDPAVERRAP